MSSAASSSASSSPIDPPYPSSSRFSDSLCFPEYTASLKWSTIKTSKPANSKDPAWKYGFWPNLGNKNLVECMLCGFHSTGGIQRLKQHIVGGFSNARKCLKASPNIVTEIIEYMEQNKRKRPSSFDESQERTCWDEDGSDEEDDPLGLKIASQSRKKPNVRGSMDVFVRSDLEKMVNAKLKGKQLVQKTMSSIAKKKKRNAVAQKFTRFMYQAGIPFNVLRLKSFHVAIEAISNFGPGFKPPTYHEARVTFLKKEVKSTTELLDLYKRSWKIFGCTIMSDGWTDKRSRHLINFLVNCPEGTYFLKSVDASDKIKDADYIFQELDKVIDEIGEQHVIQVVSNNNGHAYVKAGKMLMQKRQHLFWTPCAAHCLDLILEEIAKLPLFKKAISRGRAITSFIYKHSRLLAEMRKETNGKELVRAGVTRFATAFLTLQSLYSHKAALKSLFVSKMWLQSAWAKKQEGQKVAEIILSTSFWKGVCNCLRAGEPLVQILRLVDSDDKPPMGYLYNAAELAKDKIKVYFDFNEKTYKPIIDIIDRKLKDQLYQDLHLAGFFLNPTCYYVELESNPHAAGKCYMGFLSCVDRMVENPDTRVTIMCQVDLYKFALGPFAKDMAIRLRNKKQPHLWWDTIGNETMELKDVAVRILGLTCTSSACERNWSIFEHVHSKKRNRLEHLRLKDLAFVQFNQRLRERFLLRKEKAGAYDPLQFAEIDESSEWITGEDLDNERVHNDNDLTWGQIDAVVGASSSIVTYSRRRKRKTIVNENDETQTSREKDELLKWEEPDNTEMKNIYVEDDIYDAEYLDGGSARDNVYDLAGASIVEADLTFIPDDDL